MLDPSQVVISIITLDQMSPEEVLLFTEFKSHDSMMYITDDGNAIYTCPADFLVKMDRLVGRNFHERSDEELDILVNANYEILLNAIEN
jgi:hypothetical protein